MEDADAEEMRSLSMGETLDDLIAEVHVEHDELVHLSIADDEEEEETSRQNRKRCLIRVFLFMTMQFLIVGLVLFYFLQSPTPTEPTTPAGQNAQDKSSPIPLPTTSPQNDIPEKVKPELNSNGYGALKILSTVENIEHGAVASDHALCSKIGLNIMRDKGGNAVDAAVATVLCLGVANPASSGIGGGAFILIHSDMATHEANLNDAARVAPQFIDARNPTDPAINPQDGKITEVIDCRETAPEAATTNMFSDKADDASTWGGLAIAVPGELRGLELAHYRHGKLSWRKVVGTAMKLAKNGVKVSEHLAGEITGFFDLTDALNFVLSKNNDNVTMLQENDIMKQPTLAATLEDVMNNGADAIYTGYRASQLAQDIQKAGGVLTIHDLDNYRPVLRSPLVARDVGGYNLVGAPPPSSGGAAILGAARFLAGYQQPPSVFPQPLSKHRMVEAMRHVFSIRMSLSDPAFYENVTRAAVDDLVLGKYMESLRLSTKDEDTLPLSKYGGSKWSQLNDSQGASEANDADEGDRRRRRTARRFGYLEDHGTTHVSVVDKDGNSVALTSSVNTLFGSGVVSESTGIFLNSQMDDFATPGRPNYFGLTPSEANYIKPLKKPLSSMSPTLVFRHNPESSGLGDLYMSLGASGGPKIITAVLQTFLNYAIGGMSLFDAMIHPRLHDQLLYHDSSVTLFEKRSVASDFKIEVPKEITEGLKKRGHIIHSVGYTGCVQAIAIDPTTQKMAAVSDLRKGGKPSGY